MTEFWYDTTPPWSMPDAPGVSASTAVTIPAVSDSAVATVSPAADGAGDGLRGQPVQVCRVLRAGHGVSPCALLPGPDAAGPQLECFDDVFAAGPDA